MLILVGLVLDTLQQVESHLLMSCLLYTSIVIERTQKLVTITVCTARPGIIIGKGGQEVDKLKEELKKVTDKDTVSYTHLFFKQMRKAKPKKRLILPDPVFNDQKVSKFVNHLMYDGRCV